MTLKNVASNIYEARVLAKKENAEQISRAYALLQKKMLNFLSSKLGDRALAEDIFQTAFEKALREKELKKIANIQAWLKRLMYNAMIDHLRVSSQLQLDVKALDSLVDDEQQDLEIHQLFSTCLKPFINELPSSYSQVLYMKDFEALKIKDIATKLSLSESAVKSRLSRGRQRLKQSLEDCCDLETDNGIVLDFSLRK